MVTNDSSPWPECEWCEEGFEESPNDTLRCEICAGLAPLNDQLCASCQRFGHVLHVLYCDDTSWPGLEQDGLLDFTDQGPGSGNDEAPAWQAIPRQTVANLSNSLSCIMCTVVSELLQNDLEACDTSEAQVLLWRPFPTPKAFDQWQAQEKSNEGHFVLPTLLFKSRTDTSPCAFLLEIILKYHEHRLVKVSVWDRSLIDTEPIKEWLAECTQRRQPHEKCGEDPKVHLRATSGFRLIDTSTRCLVSYEAFEGRPEYVALSYTWASVSDTSLHLTRDALSTFYKPGAIGGSNLFVDAMYLCHSIGQRYLWIDKLCIIQDDHIDKAAQIGEMGNIYHLATLTIVALTEVNRGLPGSNVHNPRLSNLAYSRNAASWQLQPTNFVNESTGRAIPPFLDKLVDTSIWDSRGWTCQEKRLSRRLLFVTDQHVYTCCSGLISESRSNSVSSYRNYRIRSGSSYIQAGSSFERSLGQGRHLTPFNSYACAVDDYSKRKLTFWGDKLDAFRGFGDLLAVGTLSFGLPNRFFSWALLWKPLQPTDAEDLERHWQLTSSAFPSWTWASTRSGVSFALVNEASRPQDMGTLVVFYAYRMRLEMEETLDERILQPINEEIFWFDDSALNWKSEEEKGRHYTKMLHRHLPSSMTSWKECIHSPWEASKHYDVSSSSEIIGRLAGTVPGALIFNTTCAELRLSTRPMPDARPNMHHVQVNIVNKLNSVVGCIYPLLPDIEAAMKAYKGVDRDDHYYTVIVVGASLFMHWPQAPQENRTPSYSGLHVLITQRTETGLLKRVAVGMVRQSEWNGTGAKWETVVLG